MELGRQLFKWNPLSDKLSIRILNLQPHHDDNHLLQCSLVTRSLEAASDSFEAISYAWGPGEPQFRITLLVGSDSYLKITESLGAALKALRSTTSERQLWADAVCIDQHNLVEKSQQVNIMNQIFSTCTRTLVWLGEADDTIPLAFDLCRHLSQYRRAYGLHTVYPFQDGWEYDSAVAQNRNILDQDAVHGPALGSLLTRGWFWRRWMVQEVALAKAVIVQCGHCTLPWEDLATALAVIRLIEQTRSSAEVTGWMADTHRLKKHFWEPAWAIAARRLRIEHTACTDYDGHRRLRSPPSSMLEILSATSLFDCTDPRDFIFCLNALVDDIEFESNYEESVAATYSKLADTYLYGQERCRTRVLHHARLPLNEEHERLASEIPSYVPNWPMLRRWGHYRLGGSGTFKFMAGFRQPSVVTRTTYGTPEIRGYRLGDLAYVGLDIETQSALEQELRTWFQNYCKDSGHRAQHLVAELIAPAMAKTLLVCNRLRATQQLLGSELSESEYQDFGANIRKLIDSDTGSGSSLPVTRPTSNLSFMPDMSNYELAALRVLVLRRCAIVDGKSLALVPAAAEEGDRVVIFCGAETPFILRDAGVPDRKCFRLVGECYVHGFMNHVDCSRLESSMFELV